MNALAVLLHLPVEHGVLVLGQHLFFARHRRLPDLQLLGGLAVPGERLVDDGHDVVDGAQPLAVAELLGGGETVRNFPATR